jgi:hypothetical protein
MSKLHPVTVLLLHNLRGEPVFLASGRPPAAAPAAPEPSGRLARLREAVYDAYNSLSHRFDHHENFCAQLRHASEIHLLHPDTLGWQQAQQEFQDFLDRRLAKHRRWRLLNALTAAAGALLTPIPGPNVFFFYPAARMLGHHFARSGALLTRLEQHQQTLDEVDAEVKELEEHYRIHQLRRVLETLCSLK